ncbi:MAG: hypothetical protein O3C25_04445 [Chloroflexi bacterium]|nr:hypothetical protein [Chloroflexota bacterium]
MQQAPGGDTAAEGGAGPLPPRLAEEGANWIAEQVSEELGGFVPAELVDLMMELEHAVRTELSDAALDHASMSLHLVDRFEAEGVPVKTGALTREVLLELLHWEDEFLSLAGYPRKVRPSAPRP